MTALQRTKPRTRDRLVTSPTLKLTALLRLDNEAAEKSSLFNTHTARLELIKMTERNLYLINVNCIRFQSDKA